MVVCTRVVESCPCESPSSLPRSQKPSRSAADPLYSKPRASPSQYRNRPLLLSSKSLRKPSSLPSPSPYPSEHASHIEYPRLARASKTVSISNCKEPTHVFDRRSVVNKAAPEIAIQSFTIARQCCCDRRRFKSARFHPIQGSVILLHLLEQAFIVAFAQPSQPASVSAFLTKSCQGSTKDSTACLLSSQVFQETLDFGKLLHYCRILLLHHGANMFRCRPRRLANDASQLMLIFARFRAELFSTFSLPQSFKHTCHKSPTQ
ncbi:hypothetical protein MRB53_038951 [Persea americana]|nr:hypothetical protein MRB53_038951 [Persea americana]